MKKKFLLVGLIAFCMVPLYASAEMADHVTIYGKIHGSLDYLDNGDDGDFFISSNSNRIGFKGSEDLGGDLSFIWQAEQTVNLDEQGGEWATRNTFAGLSHAGAGTVLFGRHDTPMKTVARKVDFFGDTIGDSRNIAGTDGAGWNHRLNNVLAYKSPDFGGVHALLAYVPDEGVDDADAYSGYLMYNQDGIMVAVAAEMHGEAIAGGSETELGVRGVVSYQMDAFKFGGLYEMIKDAGGIDGADRNAWGFGAGYTMDAWTFKGQYYGIDEAEGTDDTDAHLFAIGVDHAFTKNTTMYLAWAMTMNSDAATYGMDGGGHGERVGAFAPGEDPMGLSLGVIHKF